ncbi:hypothetical protein Tco_1527499, partial [Tanacetum coccineum]
GDGSSVSGVILLLLDGCSRTSAAWEVVVSVDGNNCGTKVCASGMKQVIVVVAVPSSITALKQYLLVSVGLFLHLFDPLFASAILCFDVMV